MSTWRLGSGCKALVGQFAVIAALILAAMTLTTVGVAPAQAQPPAPTAGAVASWGDNSFGQLGDGATTGSAVPLPVDASGALAGKTVVQLGSGDNHTCAVASDGSVACWGDNEEGQLGDGTTTDAPAPVAVDTSGALAVKTVVQVTAGEAHTCALTTDGALYCWGYNDDGQLGDGTNNSSLVPVAVDTTGALAGKTVVQVSAGDYHTCALTADNAALCWGFNIDGQLGDGSTNSSNVPVAVDASGTLTGKTLSEVSAGGYHSCALTTDGSAFCWGDNEFGALGDATTNDSSVPVAVDTSGVLAGKTLMQMSSGGYYTCAVSTDGGAFCWGDDFAGELGDGTSTDSSVPVAVDNTGALAGKTVVQVAAGFDHTCATTADGLAACWGYNVDGELGDGTTSQSSAVPVLVDTSGFLAGKTVMQVVAGLDHSCAVTTVGSVFCWGSNGDGQLGINSPMYSAVPVTTAGALANETVLQVTGGLRHSCALTDSGEVFCWGWNALGQLGDGSTTSSSVPVAVDTSGAMAGKTVVRISAGAAHTCAVTTDGSLFCWGWNEEGQLGNGSTDNSSVPVAVDASGVLAGSTPMMVSAALIHTCALTAAGEVFCWGFNNAGQLGDGTKASSSVPVAVDTSGVLSGQSVVRLSAGGRQTCVATTDGMAACWGNNTWGQLGDGSDVDSVFPVAVDTSGVLSGQMVAHIATGAAHTCAITAQGWASCWGLNESGQLGDGTTDNSPVPVAVDANDALSGRILSQITTGTQHTCVLEVDGPAYCWGNNQLGQLGDGSTTDSLVPVPVESSGVLAQKMLVQISAGGAHTAVVYRSAAAAPTQLMSQPGYEQATVMFTPGDDGGSAITNYEYQLDNGEWIPFDPAVTASPVVIPELVNGVLFGVRLRAVTELGPGLASDMSYVMPLGAAFVGVEPYRAYDSREDAGPLSPGQSRLVPTGVPAGAVAVAYNLTATGMTGSGYLTVSQGGTPAGGTSTLNYSAPGQVWANAFVSGVDERGGVQVSAAGAPTQFVLDVVGYYTPQTLLLGGGGGNGGDGGAGGAGGAGTAGAAVSPAAVAAEQSLFVPVVPTRTYDSRDIGAGGPLSVGAPRRVNVTAAGLVPPEATAVAYTLTQTGTVGRGFLAVGPAGESRPAVSSINWFGSGQTSANSSVVAITDGQVDVWAGSSTGGSSEFIIDLLGYYLPADQAPGASGFTPVDPARAYDSRVDQPGGSISGGQSRTTSIAVAGVPGQAAAVAYNLTITGANGSGFLTTTPGDVLSPPVASTINWWQTGQTRANGSVVDIPSLERVVSAQGAVEAQGTLGMPVTTFAGGGSTQYIMDVAGYFSRNPSG